MLDGNKVLAKGRREMDDSRQETARTNEPSCLESAGFWHGRFSMARLLVMGEDLVLRGANAPRLRRTVGCWRAIALSGGGV